jgi:hypothetical protein
MQYARLNVGITTETCINQARLYFSNCQWMGGFCGCRSLFVLRFCLVTVPVRNNLGNLVGLTTIFKYISINDSHIRGLAGISQSVVYSSYPPGVAVFGGV